MTKSRYPHLFHRVGTLQFVPAAFLWSALLIDVRSSSLPLFEAAVQGLVLGIPLTSVLLIAYTLSDRRSIRITVVLLELIPTMFPVYVLLRYPGLRHIPEELAGYVLLFALMLAGQCSAMLSLRLTPRVRPATVTERRPS